MTERLVMQRYNGNANNADVNEGRGGCRRQIINGGVAEASWCQLECDAMGGCHKSHV